MNEIGLVHQFVIDQFDKNNLVNSISIVPTIELDMNKENIYPLVNISLQNSIVSPDTIFASFEIVIIEQRIISPTKTDSKLLGDTNYLDNINETHSIATKFLNYVFMQNNDKNIELENVDTIEFLKNWGRSGCDGVRFTIDLKIPNNSSSC